MATEACSWWETHLWEDPLVVAVQIVSGVFEVVAGPGVQSAGGTRS